MTIFNSYFSLPEGKPIPLNHVLWQLFFTLLIFETMDPMNRWRVGPLWLQGMDLYSAGDSAGPDAWLEDPGEAAGVPFFAAGKCWENHVK